MQSLRIVFAGTPEFATPALSTLLQGDHQIVGVYTQPDRPAGRGRKLQASPVKKLALEYGAPIYQPASLRSETNQAELAALRPDLMIVAAYGLILPQAVLDTPAMGCINIHASLLPRWRGAAPIQRAILAGDAQTGVTIMQMEAGLDTGPMLLKQVCPIGEQDNAQTLHDRLAQIGARTLAAALEQWKTLQAEPQDNRQATYAHKLDKSEALLDWREPAIVLARKVRAFNPWPMAQGEVKGLMLRIGQAEALSEHSDAMPGTLMRCSQTGVDVAAGQGALRLLRVQKAGGRMISAGDFLNAHPNWLLNA